MRTILPHDLGSSHQNWQKTWVRKYGVELMLSSVLGPTHRKELLGYSLSTVLILPEQAGEGYYMLKSEYELLLSSLSAIYLDNLDNLETYYKNFPVVGTNFVNHVKALSENLHNKSKTELRLLFEDFHQTLVDYQTDLWLTFILNELTIERLTKEIAEASLSPKDREKLIHFATQPSQLAGVLLLNAEGKKYSISELQERFAWITTLDIDADPATEEDIRSRITGHIPETLPVPIFFNSLPERLQRLSLLSREVVFGKDLRDDFRRQLTYASYPLFERIGSELNIPRQAFASLLPEEILNALDGKNSGEIEARVKKRKENGFAFYFHNGHLQFEDEPQRIEDLAESLGIKAAASDVNRRVAGLTAYKGVVQGRIKVIVHLADLEKVQPGDVLCAVTTNPDYLPAMRKAAAFITDEGGLTCHAAIVARELRIPCIVGTRTATQFLRDGDLVKVNADEGWVKVLHEN